METTKIISVATSNEGTVMNAISNALNRCQFGVALIVRSTVRLQGGKGAEKAFTDLFGGTIICKVSAVENVRGFDYGAAVARAGATGFVPSEKKGYTNLYGVFAKADKTQKVQFRVCEDAHNRIGRIGHTYAIEQDGITRTASAEEYAWIEEHLYRAPNVGAKQMAHGVTAANVVSIRYYIVENVLHYGIPTEIRAKWKELFQ